MDGITCYEMLGIPETATQAEIRKAYLSLIQEVHPDKVPNASAYWKREAERKTQEVNEAYAVLRDPEQRKLYDAALAELRQEATPPTPEIKEAIFDEWESPSSAHFCCPHCMGSISADDEGGFPFVAPCPHCGVRVSIPIPFQPPPQPPSVPKSSSYCKKCGTPLNASGYCPNCEKFRQPTSTPPQNSAPAKRSSRIGFLQGCAYLIGFAILVAVLRIVWVALAAAIIMAAINLSGLLYFRRFFGNRGGAAYIVALVLSIGFVVLDVMYPVDESKSTTTSASKNVAYGGKYSEWPCDDDETTQGYSKIDHKPCKPHSGEYKASDIETQPDKPIELKASDVEILPDKPKRTAPTDKYKVALEYCKTAPYASGFCYDNGFLPNVGTIVVGENGVRSYCPGSGLQCKPLINDNPITADEECYKSGVCQDANGPIKRAH